jgi:hypothetical protein
VYAHAEPELTIIALSLPAKLIATERKFFQSQST